MNWPWLCGSRPTGSRRRSAGSPAARPGDGSRASLSSSMIARRRRAGRRWYACFQQVRARPLVLGADLPAAGVAAEEGDVAAVGDELLQVVAHRGRPVFVVADAQHQPVVLQQLRMELEVAVDGVVELVAGLLGPLRRTAAPTLRTARRWAGRTRRGGPGPCAGRCRRTGCSRPSCCRRCRCSCESCKQNFVSLPGLAERTTKERCPVFAFASPPVGIEPGGVVAALPIGRHLQRNVAGQRQPCDDASAGIA